MNRPKFWAVAAAFVFLAVLCDARTASPRLWPKIVAVDGDGYFPVLIRLRTGEAAAVVRAGAAHIGRGGRLDLIVSRDGGRTWPVRRLVIDGPDDDRNPAFGQLPDGTLLVAFAVLKGYDAGGREFPAHPEFDGVYLTRSSDQGRTWTRPVRSESIHSFYAGRGAVSPYGKIVQAKDGTLLMAVYFEFREGGRGNESYLFRSRDGGRTWGDPSLIAKHANETGLAVLPDGAVLAALRTEKGGRILIARSVDQGHSWSDYVPVTRDGEHPGDLIVLRNRDVLLTFGERNAPRGVHALLSRDGGRTWDRSRELVLADDAPVTDCGYPSSIELAPGRILTLYYQVDDPKDAPRSAKTKAVIWDLRGR